ncbi:MAG: S-methyl-5-thioribose-1-phosphate isomerase [Dehalococcoidia bacterium]|nr:S-methyl-5-thioribose-1-phosphate isomerase [Dehalococcoidia bacterium]
MSELMQPLVWHNTKLRMLDQTQLPHREVWLELAGYRDVAGAIRDMRVRGAPAIGVAAAYGMALGAVASRAGSIADFKREMADISKTLAGTRPTARNLFAALERMQAVAERADNMAVAARSLVDEAIAIHEEQKAADYRLADIGASLIKPDSTILTHCNTGPLATAGGGTALGVIIRAYEQGKVKGVIATETRPLFQGARLTAWELKQAGIPFKLITDSMAGYVMSKGLISAVIVGADRIAANGDTANKIGTYTLSVLAQESGLPFYVAAPVSTIDDSIATGNEIVIEERSLDEVTCIGEARVAVDGVEAMNPAFDITPAKYITAIITEQGIKTS